MVRKVRLMQSLAKATRIHMRRQAGAMLFAGAAALLPLRHAHAAMNFCAAPAWQTSERTNADPGVKALVSNVQAHLNDRPHAQAKLHTEGTLPHEGIYDQSVEAEKDLDLLRDAALAWRATSDDRYLKLVACCTRGSRLISRASIPSTKRISKG
jgi:hypothetical protein